MAYGVAKRTDPPTRIVPASEPLSRITAAPRNEQRNRITRLEVDDLVANRIDAAFASFDVLSALQAVVGALDEIAPNAGIIVSGALIGSGGSIDLDAVGTEVFLQAGGITVLANGTTTISGTLNAPDGEFAGTVSGDMFTALNALFNSLTIGGVPGGELDAATLTFAGGGTVSCSVLAGFSFDRLVGAPGFTTGGDCNAGTFYIGGQPILVGAAGTGPGGSGKALYMA